MKCNKQPKAFTLIEIVVVLIILGVLAAIVLPSLFGWIKRNKTSEALLTIDSFKNQIVQCEQANRNLSGFEAVTGIENIYIKCFPQPLIKNPASPDFYYYFYDYYKPQSGPSVPHDTDPLGWTIQARLRMDLSYMITVTGKGNGETFCYSTPPNLC